MHIWSWYMYTDRQPPGASERCWPTSVSHKNFHVKVGIIKHYILSKYRNKGPLICLASKPNYCNIICNTKQQDKEHMKTSTLCFCLQ